MRLSADFLNLSSKIVFCFAGLALALLGGCGDTSNGGTDPPPAILVGLSLSVASVPVGGPQAFTATVTNDSQNKGVSWALGGSGCSGATCGTLSAATSASGTPLTYTAPAAVPSSTVTLTATSVTDTTKTATATITVTSGSTGNISIQLTPVRGGMTVTGSQVFTATVTNDVGSAGVTWSKSAGTFSSQSKTNATYVAPGTAGPITVTATSVADGSKTATATIGVTDLLGVTTYHNNLSRDGANTQEYALNVANVNTTTFGKLFSCQTDGAIYAQPLWVANFTIGGGKHNIVITATQHDSVYAFDADASPCVPYWHANLLDTAHGASSGETPVPSGITGNLVGNGFGDVASEVGITGTPVIDLGTGTIYVVSKSVSSGTTFFQRLHALDLTTGAERSSSPVAISGSVSGAGDGSSGGIVAFSPRKEFQRAGLALVNGVVYVTFASHEDNDPYHGWIIGYDKTSLAQVALYNDSPNGYRSGIWMAGGAPSADASNNLYVITGNGDYSGDGTVDTDYGDTFLKLTTSGGIGVADWFTPANQSTLDGNDTDFGSGGAAILVDQPSGSPHPQLVIGGGKEGNLFLLDRTNMGKNHGTNQVVQTLGFGNSIFATAAFWQNNLYLAGTGPLKQFAFNPSTGLFVTPAASQSSTSYGFPGASPSVSAQGSANGIVWATVSSNFGLNSSNPSRAATAAVLHAYDATSLTTDLWNSSQASGNRDKAGNCVKFTVPTVANGKVYIGTRGNDTTQNTPTILGEIDVYGLLPN